MNLKYVMIGALGFLLWVGGIFSVPPAIGNESLVSFVLPSDLITFQPGEGSSLATTYCVICHSADYIYMQPPHPEPKWEEIIHKMRHTFGCPIPDSDIPTLAKYLVSQNEMQPMPQLPNVEGASVSLKEPEREVAKGDARKGKGVFETYCVNCHGSSGKGDGPIGPSLIPPAANLTRLQEKPDKEILDTIRKGRPGTAMPSWKHDLSPQDILNILAYIRTLKP